MATITITGTYRKDSATLRPSVRASESGRRYLHINKRAFKAAESRITYAGDDFVSVAHIPRVDGFGEWHETIDGDLRAWALT